MKCPPTRTQRGGVGGCVRLGIMSQLHSFKRQRYNSNWIKQKKREFNCSHTWKSSGAAGFSPGGIGDPNHALGCAPSLALLHSTLWWLHSQVASPTGQRMMPSSSRQTRSSVPASSLITSAKPKPGPSTVVGVGAFLSGAMPGSIAHPWWAELTKATC